MRAEKIIFPPCNPVHKYRDGLPVPPGLVGHRNHHEIALDLRANGVGLILQEPWLLQDGGLY